MAAARYLLVVLTRNPFVLENNVASALLGFGKSTVECFYQLFNVFSILAGQQVPRHRTHRFWMVGHRLSRLKTEFLQKHPSPHKGIRSGKSRSLAVPPAIRIRLELETRHRDLALFNLAIDSKLRGCDLVRLTARDIVTGGQVLPRAPSDGSFLPCGKCCQLDRDCEKLAERRHFQRSTPAHHGCAVHIRLTLYVQL